MLSKIAKRCQQLVVSSLLALIRFYQVAISPLTKSSCRFHPSCSQYTITALSRFGVIKGLALSVWRILRCTPLSKGGHDPVPNKRKSENEET